MENINEYIQCNINQSNPNIGIVKRRGRGKTLEKNTSYFYGDDNVIGAWEQKMIS
jgi:hypothetical protein